MTTRPDRLAETLRAALDEEAAGVDDDALLARAVARAAERLEPRPAPVARLKTPPRRALRIALPLAAAFAASVAMAAALLSSRPPPAPEAPSAAPAPPPPVDTGGPAVRAPEATPSVSVDDLPNAAVAAKNALPAAEPKATAAELFREANAERRGGDVKKAIKLYRTLEERFPGTPESHASRVSVGRLLLEREGDATGALAEFDAYLAHRGAGDGSLDEEARIGRALALQRLGRADEERRAWDDLVERHPQSLYVPRAKQRLEALGGPR